MAAESLTKAFSLRACLGDVLILLTLALTADLLVVMLHRISTVVLKTDYRKVFLCELVLCVILLLFALDVRFCIFSMFKDHRGRLLGWGLL